MELEIRLDRFYDFVLVLARCSALIATMPAFGARHVPPQVKILVSASLAILMTVSLPVNAGLSAGGLTLVVLVIRECIIGLAMSAVAWFVFYGIEFAGEIAGMQMGFAIAGVIDPQTGGQTPLLGRFQSTLAMILFLAVGGHYFVIRALGDSMRLMPVGLMSFSPEGTLSIVTLAGKVFVIALQVAAPATILLLLVNIGLGVIARMVPQMNVFIVGFPLMISAGLAMVLIAMPAFVSLTVHLFDGIYRDLMTVVRAM